MERKREPSSDGLVVNDEDAKNPYYIEYPLIKGKWKLIKKEKCMNETN
jgi:hypothetical protein